MIHKMSFYAFLRKNIHKAENVRRDPISYRKNRSIHRPSRYIKTRRSQFTFDLLLLTINVVLHTVRIWIDITRMECYVNYNGTLKW